ncbi:MAG: hypothetical protein K0Q60_2142, partial [Microvirga sp.]|nr:hypothetical protein [Microvirga sp.]
MEPEHQGHGCRHCKKGLLNKGNSQACSSAPPLDQNVTRVDDACGAGRVLAMD